MKRLSLGVLATIVTLFAPVAGVSAGGSDKAFFNCSEGDTRPTQSCDRQFVYGAHFIAGDGQKTSYRLCVSRVTDPFDPTWGPKQCKRYTTDEDGTDFVRLIRTDSDGDWYSGSMRISWEVGGQELKRARVYIY